jgi:hypothetical protein
MILSHHLTEQLLHERQQDLLREGEARRARAAAAQTKDPPTPSATREPWLAQPQPAECRPA